MNRTGKMSSVAFTAHHLALVLSKDGLRTSETETRPRTARSCDDEESGKSGAALVRHTQHDKAVLLSGDEGQDFLARESPSPPRRPSYPATTAISSFMQQSVRQVRDTRDRVSTVVSDRLSRLKGARSLRGGSWSLRRTLWPKAPTLRRPTERMLRSGMTRS